MITFCSDTMSNNFFLYDFMSYFSILVMPANRVGFFHPKLIHAHIRKMDLKMLSNNFYLKQVFGFWSLKGELHFKMLLECNVVHG